MALIQAPIGSILQFSDGINSIPQISGNPIIFDQTVLNSIIIDDNADIFIQSGGLAQISGDGGEFILGNNNKSPVIREEWSYIGVNSGTPITSSLTTRPQFEVTGSFLMINAQDDHMLRVAGGSTFEGYIIKYAKRTGTGLLTIASTSVNNINGQTTWSCSDTYSAIELIGTTSGWRILSSYGNWA